MYKVKNFAAAREFVEFNEEFIYSNPMQNILLIGAIEKAAAGEIIVRQAFNLVNEKGAHILVFIFDGYCLIYCDKFDNTSIETLSKELLFERLKEFAFAGDKETIESLLNFRKLNFTIEKHLTIYKCEKLNPVFKKSAGKMRLATLSELEYLSNLNVDFSEEYDGTKETLSDMKKVVESEIREKSLQVWQDGKICSMAIEMNRPQFGFPEIGQVYTIPSERNKGYTSSLVYELTGEILTRNPYCMLYTHGENPASNRAFLKVGFIKTGDYARIRIQE